MNFESHLARVREEWPRHGVRRAWLFGSRTTPDATEMSDWDFLVEFEKPPDFDTFLGLKTVLENRLGQRVDLLSRTACKPRFLEAIRNQLVDVT